MAELSELKRVIDEWGRWDGLEGDHLRFAVLSLASALEEAFEFGHYAHGSISVLRGHIGDQQVIVTRDQIETLWREIGGLKLG